MHRLSSTSIIRRFRLVAFLLCTKWVMAVIAFGILIHAMITDDPALAMICIGLMLLTLLIALLQWILAARTGCPLCMTPVLAKKHCAHHRNARPFLGSYRLRVALTILFRNSFQCPYCDEMTAMEIRKKKHLQKKRREGIRYSGG